MACEICEHCEGYTSPEESYILNHGYSYHVGCHKCFVCSETSLYNAEVFKGVLFCENCAHRIFQGCCAARKSRNKHERNYFENKSKFNGYYRNKNRKESGDRIKTYYERNRSRFEQNERKYTHDTERTETHNRRNKQNRRRSKRFKRIESSDYSHAGGIESRISNNKQIESQKSRDKRLEKSINTNCEFETTRLSKTTNLESKSNYVDSFRIIVPVTELKSQSHKSNQEVENFSSLDSTLKRPKDSVEIGVVTDVTNELLRQVQNPIITNQKFHSKSALTIKNQMRVKAMHKNDKKIFSDVRMAELGASTEIANMALRLPEPPFTIKSESALRTLPSVNWSIVDEESDISDDSKEKATDSAYSTLNEKPNSFMDRRVRSVLMMPYNYFKANIIDKSSLISIIANMENERKTNILDELKALRHEEVIEHHQRGMKRLYPTIQRWKVPYRMGWLHCNTSFAAETKCNHMERSHSYRCMRSHVMRRAGPTKSELAYFRGQVVKSIIPTFLKNFAVGARVVPPLMTSQACGSTSPEEN